MVTINEFSKSSPIGGVTTILILSCIASSVLADLHRKQHYIGGNLPQPPDSDDERDYFSRPPQWFNQYHENPEHTPFYVYADRAELQSWIRATLALPHRSHALQDFLDRMISARYDVVVNGCECAIEPLPLDNNNFGSYFPAYFPATHIYVIPSVNPNDNNTDSSDSESSDDDDIRPSRFNSHNILAIASGTAIGIAFAFSLIGFNAVHKYHAQDVEVSPPSPVSDSEKILISDKWNRFAMRKSLAFVFRFKLISAKNDPPLWRAVMNVSVCEDANAHSFIGIGLSKSDAKCRAKVSALETMRNVLNGFSAQDETQTTSDVGDTTQDKIMTTGILVENRDISSAIPADTLIGPFSKSINVPAQSVLQWTDRPTNWETLELSTADLPGEIIWSRRWPYDFMDAHKESLVVGACEKYAYWRPQGTLRFQINATNFHQGLYFVGLKYYASYNYSTPNPQQEVTHVAQIFQLHNARLNICGANVAELKIPYVSYMDVIPTHFNEQASSSNYICDVVLGCLSPLRTGTGNLAHVTVSVQAIFSCDDAQTEFFGLMPTMPLWDTPSRLSKRYVAQDLAGIVSGIGNTIGDIGNIAGSLGIPGAGLLGSAASIAGGIASSVISPIEGLFGGIGSIFKVSNRDKPYVPTPPERFIRYPTTPLSNGSGPTHCNPLRLNPATNVPHHPESLPTTSELISWDPANIWGLVNFQANADPVILSDFTAITTDLMPGAFLGSIPITPLSYCLVGDNYLPTGVGGVAGFYQFWCGENKYLFSLVKSNPHSVRLRFVLVPVDYPGQDSDPELWRSTLSTVYDFEDTTEVEIDGNFFCPMQLAPTFHVTDVSTAPIYTPVYYGRIAVFLESRLITMESVHDRVFLYCFHKASKEMCFSAPCTSFWQPVAAADDFFLSISNPSDVLIWEHLPTGGWLHVNPAFFNKNKIYAITNLDQTPNPTCEISPGIILIGDGITVNSVVGNTSDCVSYSLNDIEPGTPINISVTALTSFKSRYFVAQDDVSVISQERTKELDSYSVSKTRVISAVELNTGEEFPLRDVVRRFEVVGNFKVTIPAGENTQWLEMPLNALNLPRTSGTLSNISVLGMAYRFSKASYQFLLININRTTNTPVNVRAFYDSRSRNAIHAFNNVVYDWNVNAVGHEVVNREDSEQIVSFYVPYYNSAKMVVNDFPIASDVSLGLDAAYTPGYVRFSFNRPIATDEPLELEYILERSLGDDAEMYVFQGWPVCQPRPFPISGSTQQFFAQDEELEPETPTVKPMFFEFNSLALSCCTSKDKRIAREGRMLLKYYGRVMRRLFPRYIAQDQVSLSPDELNNFILLSKNLAVMLKQSFEQCMEDKRAFLDVAESFVFTDPSVCDLILALIESVNAPCPDSDTYLLWKQEVIAKYTELYSALSNPADIFFEIIAIAPPKFSWFQKSVFYVKKSAASVVPSWLSGAVDTVLQATGDIGSIFSAIKDKLMDKIVLMNVAFSMFTLFNSRQLVIRGMALMQILANLGIIDSLKVPIGLGLLLTVIERFRPHYAGKIMLDQTFFAQDTVRDEDTDEKLTNFASLIFGGIAATCALSSAPSWNKGTVEFLRVFPYVCNQFHRLFSTVLKFALRYVYYALGIEHPEVVAMNQLKELDVDIEKWASRVLEVTDPSMNATVQADPALRREVASLYETGSKLILSITETARTKPGYNVFMNLFVRLSKLYEEVGELPDSLQANVAPVTIWFSGDAGIGKTEMAKIFSIDLAKYLSITHIGDPVFTRSQRKYWDGYTNQPIILFDDFMQLRSPESLKTYMEDWFGLCTGAPFSPEFSCITEKKRVVAPKIIVALCNKPFPDPQIVISPPAFNRRRDILCHVRLTESFKKTHKVSSVDHVNVPLSAIQDFQHLEFCCTDPTNPSDVPKDFCSLPEFKEKAFKFLKNRYDKRLASAQKKLDAGSLLDPRTIDRDIVNLVSSSVSNVVGGTIVESLVTPEAVASVFSDKEDTAEPYVAQDACECESKIKACHLCHDFHPATSQGRIVVKTPLNNQLVYCFDCRMFCDRTHVYPPQGECVCWKSRSTSLEALKAEKYAWYVKTRDEYFNGCLVSQRSVCDLPGRPSVKKGIVDPAIKKIKELFSYIKSWSFWSAIATLGKWILIIFAAFCVLVLFVCRFLPKIWLMLTGTEMVVPAYDKEDGKNKHVYDYYASNHTYVKKPGGREPTDKDMGLFRVFGAPTERSVQGQLASSGDVRTSRPASSAGPKVVRFSGQEEEIPMTKRLLRNRVNLIFHANGKRLSTYGVGLRGRYILIPRHTVNDLKDIDCIEITHYGNGTLNAATVTVLEDGVKFHFCNDDTADLAIMQLLVRTIPEFPNIMGQLANDREIKNVHLQDCTLVDFKDAREIVFPRINPYSFEAHYENKNFYASVEGYEYPYQRPGLCGSPLVDTRSNRIIGIHVAGSGNNGYSQIVSRNMFEGFPFDGHRDVEIPELAPAETQLKGNFIPIGKVAQDMAVTPPFKTDIRKSECMRLLGEPVRYPAKLTPPLTNLVKGLEKAGEPTITFRRDIMDTAQEDLLQCLIAKCPPVIPFRPKRTINEAICGIPGVEFMNSLYGSSSPGWPLCAKHKGSKKSSFVQYDPDKPFPEVIGLHQDLIEHYQQQHQLRLQGIKPFDVFTAFLKDERLKPGKATRIIEGASFSSSIESRRYGLMDFCAAVMQNRLEIGVGMGINVHGFEWTQLFRKLGAGSKKILCGDYSGFGPGLNTEVLIRCFEIAFSWMNYYCPLELADDLRECGLVLRSLSEELAFSNLLVLDTVFQTVCGSPSGNQFTTLWNSLVNLMYVRIAWLYIMDGTCYGSMAMFHSLTYTIVVGDDLLIALAVELVEVFNNGILQDFFAQFGIKYTDGGDKTLERAIDYREIWDAVFLKTKFAPHPTRSGYVIAQLDETVIRDIPNWIRRSADNRVAAMENCRQALRLLYAYGPDVYSEASRICEEYWISQGVIFPKESWTYLDQVAFGEVKSDLFQWV